MTANGWVQIALYRVIIIALSKPLGGYMTRVFNGECTFLSPIFRPVERAIYAIWDSETDVQCLRMYIRTLRQKIESNPEQRR